MAELLSILTPLAIAALAIVLWLTRRQPSAGSLRHARMLQVQRKQIRQQAEALAMQREAMEAERQALAAWREGVDQRIEADRAANADSREAMELHAAALTRLSEQTRRQATLGLVLHAVEELDRLRTAIVVTTGEEAGVPIRHATWRRAVEQFWRALPARSRELRLDAPELESEAELDRLREDARAVHDGGREQIDRFVRQLDVALRLIEQSPVPEDGLRLIGAQLSAGELAFLIVLGQLDRLPDGMPTRMAELGLGRDIRCTHEWQQAFVRSNGRIC